MEKELKFVRLFAVAVIYFCFFEIILITEYLQLLTIYLFLIHGNISRTHYHSNESS